MSVDSQGSANAWPGLVSSFFSARKAASAPAKPSVAFKAIGSSIDGVIIGIGASAGTPDKVDKDNEYVDVAGLQKMAYDFCAASDRTFKANHQEEIAVDLVASWPGCPIVKCADGTERRLELNEPLADDMDVVGIDITKGRESHWFVGARPRDPEIAALAAKGGIAGFSFGAVVNRLPAEEN